MKNKKTVIKYFIIMSIIIIGILPIINFYQYAIKYDFKKLFNTDKVEMYINYAFYKILNKSLEYNKVITGKDDFLFLGNNSAQVLHKTQGIYVYNEKDINNWTKKLKNIQTWYEERGIKFIIVIAPNKHTVYKEKLPRWVEYKEKTITDDILKYSHKNNINILDLRDFLISKKSDKKLLYYKYGTHWNYYGASLGYEKTIEYLNNLYDINIEKLKYNIVDNIQGYDRGLIRYLKLKKSLFNVSENDYTFNLNNKLCHGNINQNSFKLNECKIINNPIIFPNNEPSYIINKNANNDQTLLLLADSFSGANSQLYNSTFSKIFRWHIKKINGKNLANFTLKQKPNIVIYQIVERGLYNNYIVKKFPNIRIVNYTNSGNKIFDINKNKYDKKNKLTISEKEFITRHSDPIIILNKLKTKSKLVRINYNLDSSVKTQFQLFYKENENDKYTEKNSYNIAIKKGNNKISLSIPAKYINNDLRVDLVSTIGKYKINDFSIYEVK